MRKCKYELCSLSPVGPILQNIRNRSKIWGNSSKSHKHLVGFGCNSASAILSKTFCPCARTGHLLSHPLIDYSGKSTAIAICVENLCNLWKGRKGRCRKKSLNFSEPWEGISVGIQLWEHSQCWSLYHFFFLIAGLSKCILLSCGKQCF